MDHITTEAWFLSRAMSLFIPSLWAGIDGLVEAPAVNVRIFVFTETFKVKRLAVYEEFIVLDLHRSDAIGFEIFVQ
jgi:hypothetical protein